MSSFKCFGVCMIRDNKGLHSLLPVSIRRNSLLDTSCRDLNYAQNLFPFIRPLLLSQTVYPGLLLSVRGFLYYRSSYFLYIVQ